MRLSKIIEYLTLLSMLAGGALWISTTIATKTDVLLAMNTIEEGRIASDLIYYERVGTENLSAEDKIRFDLLTIEEKANEAQRRQLLGLD